MFDLPNLKDFSKVEFYFIGIFPFVWILGLSLVYFQILVLYLILRQYFIFNKIPSLVFPLICYVVFYFSSILINFSLDEFERFVASMNNLTIWIFGILFAIYVANSPGLDRKVLERSARYVFFVIFLASIYVIFIGEDPVYINSIFGMILNPDSFPQLVTDSLRLKLTSKDWFDGAGGVRNAIFSPYSTATAAVSIILYSILISELHNRKLYFLYTAMCFVCVVSTYSRLLVILFIGLIFLNILTQTKKGQVRILVVLVGVVLSLAFLPVFLTAWDNINELRSGSSDIRFEVYRETYNVAITESPIIGLGMKSRGEFFIPLGSHSTYLGAFLKVGIIGFLCLIIYSLMIFFRLVIYFLRGGSRSEGVYLCVIFIFSIFMVFEDMDAAQYMSFLYFLILGLYLRSKVESYQ